MVKIAYCSDLHLDNYRLFGNIAYPPILNPINDKADILIIAGDIFEYKYMYQHINFINALSESYEYVLLVEGNHEFYEGNINQDPPFEYPDNVILLKNETFTYKDIVFYGGTLWANVSDLSSLDQFNISQMIADFTIIEDDEAEDGLFTIDRMTLEYNKFIEGIFECHLNLKDNQKLFVISHFAPSIKSVTPQYAGSALNPYFCNNLDDMITGLDIDYFVHGHVHSSHDYMLGNTRVLCNPRGYPREIDHIIYLPKMIEI